MAVTGSICTNRLQLHAQAERDPALISRNLAELLRWWEAGRLKPLVAEVFPLAEVSKALTALLSRRYAGKLVLET